MDIKESIEKIRQNPRGDWSEKTLESLKKGILEYEAWVDSVLYTDVDVFKSLYPDNQSFNDCSHMIRYIGELYIGCTENGTFKVGSMTYSKLNIAELSLWDKEGRKLFHNQ